MAAIPPYPIYHSSFTTYRASPLYHGSSEILDDQNVKVHARRLRDILRGDTVRGVHVGFGAQDDGLGRSGAFQECTWNLLGDEATWRAQYRAGSGEEMDRTELSAVQVGQETVRGVHVQVRYERATHSALLLRDPAVGFEVAGFTSLPLLMVRMPASLREIFLEYITTNFDTRLTPLKLSSSFLTSSLEGMLRCLNPKENAQALDELGGGVRLQLSFPGIGPSLRNIDVTIAPEDIGGFIIRGQTMFPESTSPFTAAFTVYAQQHLALDLTNPGVQFSKIICGPLALSGDGKVKMFPLLVDNFSQDSSFGLGDAGSATAIDEFYTTLCREAASSAVFVAKYSKPHQPVAASNIDGDAASNSQPCPNISPKEMRRQPDSDDVSLLRVKGRHPAIPIDPPPPYALHDPSWGGTT